MKRPVIAIWSTDMDILKRLKVTGHLPEYCQNLIRTNQNKLLGLHCNKKTGNYKTRYQQLNKIKMELDWTYG